MKELVISENSHTVYVDGLNLSLKEYIEAAHDAYKIRSLEHRRKYHESYSIRFEDEELIWAIQEWFGAVGEFSDDELFYLEEVWDLDQIDIETICLDND